GDQTVRNALDDLGLPLDARAERGGGNPARSLAVDLRHRLEMRHELREVLEVAPEAVDVIDRRVDDDALLDTHRLALVARVEVAGARIAHRAVARAEP